MADKIRVDIATGKSRDGITGEVIPAGTLVAHVAFNARCAPFLTAAGLRRLADEIDRGEGLVHGNSVYDTEPERWPESGQRQPYLQERAAQAARTLAG